MKPRVSQGRMTPIAPWPEAGTLEAHVRGEQVRQVFQQAPPAQLISIFAVSVAGAALWDVADHERVLVWVLTVSIMTIGRIMLALRFRSEAPAPDAMPQWETAFLVTLALVSLSWGVGGWIVMPPDSLLHQAIIYFFLMGVAGGAVATYAAHPAAAAIAVCSLMVPATVFFAVRGPAPMRYFAAAGVLYILTALRGTAAYGAIMRQTFQLSWELHSAYGRAQDLARTDELTDLANRRAFVERGNGAMEQARRYGRPLSLVMFDIDHFKKINDTFGHAAGDAALRSVSAALKAAARASDTPGRLGGEEFGLLLPETAAASAMIVAERLRRDVAALVVKYEGQEIRFTCSFGVAERQESTTTLDVLMSAADEALYHAKESGRDRVMRQAIHSPTHSTEQPK